MHEEDNDVLIDLPFLDDTGSNYGSLFPWDLAMTGVDDEYPFLVSNIEVNTANGSIRREVITLDMCWLNGEDKPLHTPFHASFIVDVDSEPTNRIRSSGDTLRIRGAYTATCPNKMGILYLAARKKGITDALPAFKPTF